jgi:hypothetical protein
MVTSKWKLPFVRNALGKAMVRIVKLARTSVREMIAQSSQSLFYSFRNCSLTLGSRLSVVPCIFEKRGMTTLTSGKHGGTSTLVTGLLLLREPTLQ